MPERGLVVARHRRHVTVEDAAGARHQCALGSRRLRPLVGDDVQWRRQADGGGIVTGVAARRSLLTRIDSRGRREAVAANLSQILVVAAPVPSPDWALLDRYLVAAELMPAKAVIVFNKCDLMSAAPEPLQDLERIGYIVRVTSALLGTGLAQLADVMAHERGVVVGQSGTGKSSLINALLGEQAQAVGALTEKGDHGRHTTSAATLFRLANGGEFIDSPGVRNYAPYIESVAELERGFREFRPHLGTCRFDDCRHLAEPDCAVKAALDAGSVSRRRYASYTQLCDLVASARRSHRAPRY